jgi:anti-sigma factor RsiW
MNMEDRLWDFIDGRTTPAERAAVEALIENDPAWAKAYRAFAEVNVWLGEADLEVPSLRFTKNIMEAVEKKAIARPTSTYISKRLLRGVALFFGGMILAATGLVLWIWKPDTTPSKAIVKMPTFALPSYSFQVPAYLVSGCVLLLVIAGFIFLDAFLHGKRKMS